LSKKQAENKEKSTFTYREEEIPECECIYG